MYTLLFVHCDASLAGGSNPIKHFKGPLKQHFTYWEVEAIDCMYSNRASPDETRKKI
jgi:hypothetical protein